MITDPVMVAQKLGCPLTKNDRCKFCYSRPLEILTMIGSSAVHCKCSAGDTGASWPEAWESYQKSWLNNICWRHLPVGCIAKLQGTNQTYKKISKNLHGYVSTLSDKKAYSCDVCYKHAIDISKRCECGSTSFSVGKS